MRRALTVSFLLLVLGLVFAPALHAQGCVMCYTAAAGQDPAAARKLDFAILALLIPVLVLFLGVLGLAIYRRDAEVEEPAATPLPTSSPRSEAVIRLHLDSPHPSGD